MSAHEIIRIANELAAKGLTPTTAMIKARLTQPVPMAELAPEVAPQMSPAEQQEMDRFLLEYLMSQDMAVME